MQLFDLEGDPMPMGEAELAIIQRRAEAIDASIRDLKRAQWPDRAEAAARHLEDVHAAWWKWHLRDPTAYQRDIDRLNDLARWRGPYAQASSTVRAGRRYLTPPKFFGGDPRDLAEGFVLSVALNHAMPQSDTYIAELQDLQEQAVCLEAHRDYFRKPYSYERFFSKRALVLAAYARASGAVDVEPADWRTVNQRYSLYVERYPTLSANCGEAEVAHEVLEREVFTIALNALAHRVVLRLLQPKVILLAGLATWQLVPESDPRDISRAVRPSQKPVCPATIDEVALEAGTVKVLRCYFLRTVYGPNSDDELVRLGRLLAAPLPDREQGGPSSASAEGEIGDDESWNIDVDNRDWTSGLPVLELNRRGTLDDLLRAAFDKVWERNPHWVIGGADLIREVSTFLPAHYAENSIRARIAYLAQEGRSSISRRKGRHGYLYDPTRRGERPLDREYTVPSPVRWHPVDQPAVHEGGPSEDECLQLASEVDCEGFPALLIPVMTETLIAALERLGMTDQEFESLHHMRHSPARHLYDCQQVSRFSWDSANATVARRLLVALVLRSEGAPWSRVLRVVTLIGLEPG